MPERRREHRDGGLHVDADVAGVDRDVVRLGRRQAGLVACRRPAAPRRSRRGRGRRCPRCRRRGSGARSLPCRARRSRSRRRRRPPARGGPRSCRLLRRSCSMHANAVIMPTRVPLVTPWSASGPALARFGAMSQRPAGPGPRRPCAASTATRGLDAPDLAADPVAMFRRWLDDAVAAGLHEPNAMVVSTVSADGAAVVADGAAQGRRRARLRVLHQLRVPQGRASSPPTRACALLFPWHDLAAPGPGRGHGVARSPRRRARPTSPSRPRESQLGAWASPQSRVVASRAALDERYGGVLAQFADVDDVPLPPYWGGFRVAPERRGVLAGPEGPDARPAALPPRARPTRTRRGPWSGSRRNGKPLVSECSLI